MNPRDFRDDTKAKMAASMGASMGPINMGPEIPRDKPKDMTVQQQLDQLHNLLYEISSAVQNLGDRLYPIRCALPSQGLGKQVSPKTETVNVIAKINDIGQTGICILENISSIISTLQL